MTRIAHPRVAARLARPLAIEPVALKAILDAWLAHHIALGCNAMKREMEDDDDGPRGCRCVHAARERASNMRPGLFPDSPSFFVVVRHPLPRRRYRGGPAGNAGSA